MTGPTFHVPDVDELPALDEAAAAGDPSAPPPPDLTVIDGGGLSVTTDQVAAVIELPFAIMALRRGPDGERRRYWKLDDDEAATVAEPLARIVNRHAIAARALNRSGDGLAVTIALGLLVSARVMEDSDRASSRDKRRARAAGNDPATSGVPRPSADDARGDPDRLDAGGPRLNGINGFGGFPAGGPDADPAGEAAPTAAPGDRLRQALNF